MGEGIVRKDAEEDGKKDENESLGEV